MKYFIQRVEEQLYMESETSQTKVTVSHNRLDVYKRRPDTLKRSGASTTRNRKIYHECLPRKE